MEAEKKYFGGWFVWIFFLLLVAGIVTSLVNGAGLFGKTWLERKVFETSYQKKEADKTALTTYQAELAMLRGKLNNPSIDTGTRAEIQAQIDSIQILKAGKLD